MSNFKSREGPRTPFTPPLPMPMVVYSVTIGRIHVMADIFLTFKLRVEVSDNAIRSCI